MNSQNLALQIKKSDKDFFDTLTTDSEFGTLILESRGIDGGYDILSILLGLTTTSITATVGLVIAYIRSKRYIKIVVDGVEISGISESNAKEILHQILQKRDLMRSKEGAKS